MKVLIVIVGIFLIFHFFTHKTVWQANYELTTSEIIMPGPTFDSEAACLEFVHESHPFTTYGWECGSNCKRGIANDATSPFVCDETAQ